MVLGLPIATYLFFFECNRIACLDFIGLPYLVKLVSPYEVLRLLPSVSSSSSNSSLLSSLFSFRASVAYVIWFALNVMLYFVIPVNAMAIGAPLPIGTARLQYPINGFRAMIVTIGLVIGAVWAGIIPASFAYDEFLPLLSAATLFSFALSLFLYFHSLKCFPHQADSTTATVHPTSILALGGHTGVAIYDFFIGRTLNPRIAGLDLKFFCELRPGLVLWMLINFSMAAKQYEESGTLSSSMMLVCVFQAIYVFDALSSEPSILTTMDITTDGFGFMLVFGDLAWVPFVYSLQSRYLVDHPSVTLSTAQVILILFLKLVGFAIFRGANSEKDAFRSRGAEDPSVRDLQYLTTSTGSKLLISGWWGRSRHINYLGDLLMGLAWCLPCGFHHALPYFYFIYFSILLIHRQRRDDAKCLRKYGEDWKKYCRIVPYRIVPYVY